MYNNEIQNLDVTMMDSLEKLECQGNQLSNIDLTQNPLLNC